MRTDNAGNILLNQQEWSRVQAEAQKGAFSQEIWDRAEQLKTPDGKPLGDELRKIIKQTHPNVPQPGHDEKKEVMDYVRSLEKRLEDEKKTAKERAEDDAWNRKIAEVRDAYNYSDEDLKKLDGFMRANHVYDPEIAAREMNRRNPRMTDAGDGDSMFMNYPKTDGWDQIAKNPEKWAHDQIYAAAKRQEENERGRRF